MTIHGDLIKKLRIKKGLTIRELAEMAGIAKSQVSDIENRQLQNTTIDTLCKLAKALGVEAKDLFDCD